jgi:hypothetical protein
MKTIEEPKVGRKELARTGAAARERPAPRGVRTGRGETLRRGGESAVREKRAAEDAWPEADRHPRSWRGPEYWYG